MARLQTIAVLVVSVTAAHADTPTVTVVSPQPISVPPLYSDVGSVTLRDFLQASIDALRHVVDQADANLSARLSDLRTTLTHSMDMHQADDSEMSKRVADLERRFAAIDVNARRLDDLSAIVSRNSDRLTTIETGGSKSAQEAGAAVAAIRTELTGLEGQGTGVGFAWNIVLAIGGVIVGVVTVIFMRPHPANGRRRP